MKREPSNTSKIISDDLIDIFGQSEQEILKFVGFSSDADEYELNFTQSAEILDLDSDFDESKVGEGLQAESPEFGEDDKELALAQIQAKEAEIAADINKYLKVLKSKESLEFEQITREEIFERLKCKCFEWNRIKKKETIKDIIKQICKAQACKREAKRKEEKAKKEKEKQEEEEERKRKLRKKKKSFGVCTGRMTRKYIKRKSRKYTRQQIKELALIRAKISRDTIRTEIKRFADFAQSTDVRSKDESSSSEETTTKIKSHKQFLRAKDSVLIRKKVEHSSAHRSDDSSTESASSTMSGNIQHLDALEKIGKRKVHPKMFNMYLNEFNSIKNFAFVYVDNFLQEAETKANVSIMDPLEFDLKEYICPEYMCGDDYLKPPSIGEKTVSLYSQVYGYDLTPHEGKNMVRDILKYWKVRKTWKYCINYLGQQSDACSDYYKYEVKWSEPTFSYPVPQVTASVFFTIELSRIKPTLFPPKVSVY